MSITAAILERHNQFVLHTVIGLSIGKQYPGISNGGRHNPNNSLILRKPRNASIQPSTRS